MLPRVMHPASMGVRNVPSTGFIRMKMMKRLKNSFQKRRYSEHQPLTLQKTHGPLGSHSLKEKSVIIVSLI